MYLSCSVVMCCAVLCCAEHSLYVLISWHVYCTFVLDCGDYNMRFDNHVATRRSIEI